MKYSSSIAIEPKHAFRNLTKKEVRKELEIIYPSKLFDNEYSFHKKIRSGFHVWIVYVTKKTIKKGDN